MSYTNGLDDPTLYFNTVLYTGNGSTNAITGVGHQPDFTWIKRRNSAEGHILIDSVRGVDKRLGSNVTSAESTVTYFTSFDTDGFTVNGTNVATNASGGTFCAWNWLAGGTASSNTDGDITSSVSANTTAGFSVVTYTGSGSNPVTIGHGLGAVPQVMLLKKRTGASALSWKVYHKEIGAGKYLILNGTDAEASDTTIWNNTTPSSSVFTVGSSDTNNTDNYVVYCFAEKKGFSKFGSYTGNNNNDGTFVYTGMRPAFVMVKRTDSTLVANWSMFDNKRSSYNIERSQLEANTSDAEQTDASGDIDLLSNGFKLRSTADENNDGGGTYIYMAFAENPFVSSSGIPTTAR